MAVFRNWRQRRTVMSASLRRESMAFLVMMVGSEESGNKRSSNGSTPRPSAILARALMVMFRWPHSIADMYLGVYFRPINSQTSASPLTLFAASGCIRPGLYILTFYREQRDRLIMIIKTSRNNISRASIAWTNCQSLIVFFLPNSWKQAKKFFRIEVFIYFGMFNLSSLAWYNFVSSAPFNAIVFEEYHAYEMAVDSYSTRIFETNLLWAFFHNILDIRD